MVLSNTIKIIIKNYNNCYYYNLVGEEGRKYTPICDDSHGSGKTSLVFKFRKVLAMNDQWKEPDGYTNLKEAIYLHIRLTAEDSRPLKQLCEENNYCPNIFDHQILTIISYSLKSSCRKTHLELDCSNLEIFLKQLQSLTSVKFIFHFDGVGSLQTSAGKEISIMMIYRLWIIADSLKSIGHYYALTGRYLFN